MNPRLYCVRPLEVRGPVLQVADRAILDRRPMQDIKPCVPAFDASLARRIGWCAQIGSRAATDGRLEAGGP